MAPGMAYGAQVKITEAFLYMTSATYCILS